MGKVHNALIRAGQTGQEESGSEELELVPDAQSGAVQGKEKEPPGRGDLAPIQENRRKVGTKSRGGPAVQETATASSGKWNERLQQAVAVAGPVAESIRTLRTRIMHPKTGEPPRTLLVTSAIPGEGKSFITANLGVALAQGIDRHCLMVDCDLRRPSLHGLFGVSNNRGLVENLRDHVGLENLLVGTGADKLSLLPAGPAPINPSELLSSSSMSRLIIELAARYEDRIILFDSPPLRSASETAILAQQVDGVILVIRWGGSRREHVSKLVNILGSERIAGVVFNAYRSNIFDAKVFGEYEYQDSYGYGKERT